MARFPVTIFRRLRHLRGCFAAPAEYRARQQGFLVSRSRLVLAVQYRRLMTAPDRSHQSMTGNARQATVWTFGARPPAKPDPASAFAAQSAPLSEAPVANTEWRANGISGLRHESANGRFKHGWGCKTARNKTRSAKPLTTELQLSCTAHLEALETTTVQWNKA